MNPKLIPPPLPPPPLRAPTNVRSSEANIAIARRLDEQSSWLLDLELRVQALEDVAERRRLGVPESAQSSGEPDPIEPFVPFDGYKPSW